MLEFEDSRSLLVLDVGRKALEVFDLRMNVWSGPRKRKNLKTSFENDWKDLKVWAEERNEE